MPERFTNRVHSRKQREREVTGPEDSAADRNTKLRELRQEGFHEGIVIEAGSERYKVEFVLPTGILRCRVAITGPIPSGRTPARKLHDIDVLREKVTIVSIPAPKEPYAGPRPRKYLSRKKRRTDS